MDPIEAFDILYKMIVIRFQWYGTALPRSRHKLQALCIAVQEMIDLSGSREREEFLPCARKKEVEHLRAVVFPVVLKE
jgi:hypothetical protein